jgi:hypothetical protein
MTGIADEYEKLQQQNDSGALSDAVLVQAKEATVENDNIRGSTSDSDQKPAVEQLRNELRRIDRAWETEQEHHKVFFAKNTDPRVPNGVAAVMSIFGGLLIVEFGVFWIGDTNDIGAQDVAPIFGYLFPMFGTVSILIGILTPIFYIVKYSRYKSAYDEYQRRRSEVVAEFDKVKRDESPVTMVPGIS